MEVIFRIAYFYGMLSQWFLTFPRRASVAWQAGKAAHSYCFLRKTPVAALGAIATGDFALYCRVMNGNQSFKVRDWGFDA